MTEEMQKLVERIEAATGSDRVLDAEIEVATAGFPELAYQQKNGMRAKGTPPLDRMEWLRSWGVLSFTTSIDAAMKLVPTHIDCVYFSDDPSGTSWKLCEFTGGVMIERGFGVTGGLSALALCAAALRARATP